MPDAVVGHIRYGQRAKVVTRWRCLLCADAYGNWNESREQARNGLLRHYRRRHPGAAYQFELIQFPPEGE